VSRTFYATCALGLEQVLATELRALGAGHVEPQRGRVRFLGPLTTGYAACLWLRSASRVQEQLFRDRPASSREALYEAVRGFDWRPVVGSGNTLAVSAAVRASRARDSRFAALVVKDAIVDQLRDRSGSRPDVDPDDPDVPIRVVITQDRATVLRDLGGGSLHRRGWRQVQVKSPLNEAVAAGLLLLTGWDGSEPLYDPMCGSATFLVEAVHLACDRAPGLRRPFAFQRWLDHEAQAWRDLHETALARHAKGKKRGRELRVAGADQHGGALGIARRSLAAAGVREVVQLQQQAVADNAPPFAPGLVVCNPPWGLRVGDQQAAWTDLGRFLKTRCAGATAWLLSGDAALTRPLRLKAAQRHPIRIGPVDARWIRYELHVPEPSATG